jgi:hypothetical protein
VGAAPDAEEVRCLLEGFFAEAGDFFQLLTGGEGTVFIPPSDDVFREGSIQPGDVGEQLLGGGVQLHAHSVDRADNGIIKAGLESALIDIVQILLNSLIS